MRTELFERARRLREEFDQSKLSYRQARWSDLYQALSRFEETLVDAMYQELVDLESLQEAVEIAIPDPDDGWVLPESEGYIVRDFRIEFAPAKQAFLKAINERRRDGKPS